jgi:glutathione peroxidase-family protein
LFKHLTSTQDHLPDKVDKIEGDWHKFLVDRDGKIEAHFYSSDMPDEF